MKTIKEHIMIRIDKNIEEWMNHGSSTQAEQLQYDESIYYKWVLDNDLQHWEIP